MLFLRPVTANDHEDILALAREAGIGMTSLPADSHVLSRKIARAEASFGGASAWQGNEAFLFVLEDTENKRLAGTTGIVAHVGLKSPFYSYKLSTIVQAATELEVYSSNEVLHMVNDYTGTTEIGSLFLTKDYRKDGNGKFLSRSRYLMMAEFPHLFSDTVISEIRGVQDGNGDSPFYKNLAEHFFHMPFKRADFITATQGGQFISDLMPKYPVYVKLLDARAQEVIGQPLNASLPAVQMLEAEGFRYRGYVDVFDAGPTMEVERERIRTVRKSRKLTIGEIRDVAGAATHLASNTNLSGFRMAPVAIELKGENVVIGAEATDVLMLKMGDEIRIAEI